MAVKAPAVDWRVAAEQDVRVDEAYRDEDGCWIELKLGWTAQPDGSGGTLGAHSIHERQGRWALAKLRYVEACRCAECAA